MRSILVVEDSPDLRNLIKLALSNEGYDVTLASNGQEALEMLTTGKMRPNLILLDLMMPVMGGAAFLEVQRLHEGIADIPVIVCSASKTEVPADVGYLRKPVELSDLISIVQHHCG